MDSTSGSEIPVDLLKGHFSFNEKSRNKGKAQGNFLRKFSENVKSVESPKYNPFTWQNARNPGKNRDVFHGGMSQVWTSWTKFTFLDVNLSTHEIHPKSKAMEISGKIC